MMLEGKRFVLYARVSKALKQKPENQLIPLREWAERAKVKVVEELVDEITSKDTRPNKEKALKMIRTRQVDGVCVWALDRWGRTMTELVLEMDEFAREEIPFITLREGMDLSTSAGRLMANIYSAFANFERDRITERVNLGLTRARAQGKKLGNPRKWDVAEARGLRRAGWSYRKIAARLGVSHTQIRRAVTLTPPANPRSRPEEPRKR